MNPKLLFNATLALALASSLALADEPPSTTRAAVIADYQQAARTSALHRTDYDDELAARPAPGSQATRAQARAALKAPRDPRLAGPLRNRTYNQFGTDLMRAPIYTRAEVKSEVLEARAEQALRPAGEAGDQYLSAAPHREVPHDFTIWLHRKGH